MARYFDASRSLHQLEEELRRAEYGDEYDEDEDLDEEYGEEDEFDEEDEEDYDEDQEEEDEEYEEEADPRYYRRRPGRHNAFRRDGCGEFNEESSVAPRQNRRVGKLLLLALLELLGIYAIIRWWIQWL